MEKILIYTDGGARGNPGPAGIGFTIAGAGQSKEKGEYIGETTNNQAEYQALIRALTTAKDMYGDKLREMSIEVRMDSELVVRQLSGLYKVKDPGMKEQFAKVAKLRLEDCPHMIFTHVRREQNATADKLVNQAIDAAGH
jgi:ribonuclease HI